MLSAAQRLRRSSEFAAAVRHGRRAGRGAVVVHFRPPGGDMPRSVLHIRSEPVSSAGTEFASAPSRAGFVVSKAVGGAVARNTVRRRLRHLVRDRLAELPPGTTLVVRALPAAAERPFAGLAADLDAAIAAAGAPARSRRRPR